jgi:pimeloyl-ACP methyl ester carboxylesterase
MSTSGIGEGPRRVIILNDWFGDHSTWNPTLPYLSADQFTYVFGDLRGYGASRDLKGTYTINEGANDAKNLADRLGWDKFSLVGHSMSGLVAQRVAQLFPERVEKLCLIGTVPVKGVWLDDATLNGCRELALADEATQFQGLKQFWGDRLGDQWVKYKQKKWRENDPLAIAEYAVMWGRADITADAVKVKAPMLVIAGDFDAPHFRTAALKDAMQPYYPQAQYFTMEGSAHYPMQEQPPLLVTALERFLG